MMKFLALSALLIGASFADPIDFTDCGEGKTEIFQVELDGCEAAPCTVHRGDIVTGRVIFQAKEPAQELTCTLRGNIGGVFLPFPGGCHSLDACQDISSGDCPVEAGEDIIYEISDFEIQDSFPVTDVIGEWNLKNENGEKFMCLQVDISIE